MNDILSYGDHENDNMFANAKQEFWSRDLMAFLVSGFQSLLTSSVPNFIATSGTTSVVIRGNKYGFSLTNVKAHNSGIGLTEAFRHGLNIDVPITCDFQLDVIPLLAVGTREPEVLSRVRSVVFNIPICSGRTALSTSALEDPDIENHTLHGGIFICGGRMRTMPVIKSMLNDVILLLEKKHVWCCQVRSSHSGNRSIAEGNVFRFTSSIEFEIARKLKRTTFEGNIRCKLPFFKKQRVHIGVLAQALGCEPERFVELIRTVAGADYEAPIFRCYEIDILFRMPEKVTNQASAIMELSNLSGKTESSPGINLLKTEVFPHLNSAFGKANQEGLYFAKVFYLAMATSMLILFAAGRITETSRDLWQHVSVVVPAFQIGALVRTKFISHMSMFAKLLRRALLKMTLKTAPEKQTHIDLIKLFGEPRLSWRILSCVNSGTFSLKRKGVSIPMNDNNEDAMVTQLMRLSATMRTTDSTHTNPRKVQKDGYGYSCGGSSPEGDQVGLVGNFACTATLSADLEDPKGFVELIELTLGDLLMSIVDTLRRKLIIPHSTNTTIVSVDDQSLSPLEEKKTPYFHGVTIVTDDDDDDDNCNAQKNQNKRKKKWNNTTLKKKPHGTKRKDNNNASLPQQTNNVNNENPKCNKKSKRFINVVSKENLPEIVEQEVGGFIPSLPDSLSVELIRNVSFASIDPHWYIFINNCGIPTHFVAPENLKTLVTRFREARRAGDICRHAFLRVTTQPRQIRVFCEGGQIMRPLIVLNNLHKANINMGFRDMLQRGIIEWVNPAEEQTLCKGKIVTSMADLHYAINKGEHHGLTHMEFTRAAFVGLMSASIIALTSEQGPRLAYADHQKKQVMSAGTKKFRGSIMSTELWYCHAELVSTQIASLVPCAKDGGGFPSLFALITDPKAQEDGFVCAGAAVARGMFTAATTRHYTSEIKAPTATSSERFEVPDVVLSRKNMSYAAIDRTTGITRKGTVVPGGDVIISKTRIEKRAFGSLASDGVGSSTTASSSSSSTARAAKKAKVSLVGADTMSPQASLLSSSPEEATSLFLQDGKTFMANNNTTFATQPLAATTTAPATTTATTTGMRTLRRDISINTNHDESGIVHEVSQNATPAGKQLRVAVRTTRRLKGGSKLSTAHSQKGVNAEIRSAKDMYFIETTGVPIDIVTSPFSLISRMTMSTIYEGSVARAVVETGQTSFGMDNHEYNGKLKDTIRLAGQMLAEKGHRRNCSAMLRCGRTGKRVNGEIFVGIIYYKQLVHIAEKKLHFRSIGPRELVTRQPRQGRRRQGGLRFGVFFVF